VAKWKITPSFVLKSSGRPLGGNVHPILPADQEAPLPRPLLPAGEKILIAYFAHGALSFEY